MTFKETDVALSVQPTNNNKPNFKKAIIELIDMVQELDTKGEHEELFRKILQIVTEHFTE